MKRDTYHILSADIGGTNCRFAHFRASPRGDLDLVSHIWIRTDEAGSFTELLQRLRSSEFPFDPGQADMVGIALAGPVTRGVRGHPPLIPWEVDITHARRDYGFRRAVLINDFVAQAYYCLTPAVRAAETILAGSPEPRSTIAVIGAGTGLGKAILVPDDRDGYSVAPSEGAHACFPFIGERECALQRFYRTSRQIPYATYNHVVSGTGLTAVHEFLTGSRLEPAQVAERFAAHPETLEWFARFYGRACRNFALETFSRGGLYIAGGLATRNPAIVHSGAFRKEFLDSGTMEAVLERMPVHLIRDQNSGLWGAAMKAAQALLAGPS